MTPVVVRPTRFLSLAAALLACLALVVAVPTVMPAPRADASATSSTLGPTLRGLWQVSAGAQYTCGIGHGRLSCWGRNTWGQLGNGTRSGNVATPTRVGTATDWVHVSAGGSTTCGIRSGGRLYCWGLNNRGQLGDGSTDIALKPRRVPGTGWKSVDAGWYHVCAVRGSGDLFCWGDNSYGEIGRGNLTQDLHRHLIPGNWRTVRAEGWTTCGIRANDSLWCWGRNLLGQVGDGAWSNVDAPTRVAGGGSWLDVSLSWTHTCGRRTDRSVACWGSNDLGALGDGTTTARNRPTAVAGGLRARSLGVYEGGTCATGLDSRLRCWGDNRYGQGSNGHGATGAPITRPVLRSGTFSKLSGGWMHECGVHDGTVRCWGSNERGQLAQRATAARPVALRTAATRTRWRSTTALQLRMASYNLLADHMTSAYRSDDGWAPGRLRGEWSTRYVANQGLDVIGIQEGADGNLTTLLNASGGRYAAFPDPRTDSTFPESSVVWNAARFTAVEKHVIRTWSNNKELPRPYVLLQDRETGRRFWIMDIHNASADRQAKRDDAMREQLTKIRELEATGLPVFYVGDFNETTRAVCQVLRGSGLVAAQGGYLTSDGTCVPPRRMRIEWIFGSRSVQWSGFDFSHLPLVRLTSDHLVPVVDVTIP